MVRTPIYSFLALEGMYLEPTTSSQPIKVEGYEIRSDFISLVRELNFTGGLDENTYKHMQDFEEICVTLMISGMNHETLKWKDFSFSLTGWAKQWYKLHVSSCHGSWVILKISSDSPSSRCPILLIFVMRFLILIRRKERVWEQPSPDTINMLCRVQSYLFQMLYLCSILCMSWV
jgi:hypothetical protein